MRDTLTNSLGIAHESGRMTAANFDLWMTHFIKHAKQTTDDPVLLLLDNHASHLNYNAIKMAKETGVVMLTYLLHTNQSPAYRCLGLWPLPGVLQCRVAVIQSWEN